jgi:DNA-binding NtrC family response regulator
MRIPNVLLLSTDEAESTALQQTLDPHVTLRKVEDLQELQRELQGGNHDALFCGWSFHGGTWDDALEEVGKQCPDLPVIVFSRTAGEWEWIEVLKAGGFDMLVPPYETTTVLSILVHACASHDGRLSREATPVPAEMHA